MKHFFKKIILNVLSSIISLGIFLFIIGTYIGFTTNTTVNLKENSVLEINLSGSIIETPEEPIQQYLKELNGDTNSVLLWDLYKVIKHAINDDNITLIYVNVKNLIAGWAQLEEIRGLLSKAKSAGKKIVFSLGGEFISHGDYYLASIADHIAVENLSFFVLKGLGAVVSFYKNTLEKIGVRAEIFRAGKYKAAMEVFSRSDMSVESKEQMLALLNDFSIVFAKGIQEKTSLNTTQINHMLNDIVISTTKDAFDHKFIDSIDGEQSAKIAIKNLCGLQQDEEINIIPYKSYKTLIKSNSKKNKIAIIPLEGIIKTGSSSPGYIGDATFKKIIDSVKKDENIKGVIIRVNSRGGSALASDLIWRDITDIRSSIPVVVSMSNYAASGGYFIAAAADKIVAYNSTITGSIGVFYLLIDKHLLLADKLGVSTDCVKIHDNADAFLDSCRDLNEKEKFILQKAVDSCYHKFITRVSDGRKISYEKVSNIAQGRVWSGAAAKNVGLVDTIGDIDTAIQLITKDLDSNEDIETEVFSAIGISIFESLFAVISNFITNIFLNNINILLNCNNHHINQAQHFNGLRTEMTSDFDIS